jgi:hypothetical protein
MKQKVQANLAKQMGFKYRKAIGELIWSMTTCHPDLSQAVVKCAQGTAAPSETHYLVVRSIFCYVAGTIQDGIVFWRTKPRMELPDNPVPTIHSSAQDLRIEGCLKEESFCLHGYMDSSWADCPLTRRSTGGLVMRMTGGPLAWKSRLWPTVAASSTEAEYNMASDGGRMSLYCRSILWNLDIPQEAATMLYEDNDGATAMANAGKPTPRSRHIDIKYYVIQERIERDLVILTRINTSLNMGDHFTKPLPKLLFYCHRDFYMGHIPPPYSPKYQDCLRIYSMPDTKHKQYVAKAAKSLAPWEIVCSASAGLVVQHPFTIWYTEQCPPIRRG